MTLEGESRWGNKPLYGGRYVLPSGKPWIGNEDGFPADEIETQDRSSLPSSEEFLKERSCREAYGGGKQDLT